MTAILELNDICRTFQSGSRELTILKDVNLQMSSGAAIALRGPSGCGKTTLLHIAGTLDRPTSGTVQILSQNPWVLPEEDLAKFRNRNIGFVFQEHQLLPQCTVLENVLLPTLAGFDTSPKESRERANQLLHSVGLQDRMSHRPGALSGGERQRVAVCRALINQPALLLADEPTGNLDPGTAETVGELLLRMAAEQQTALLCVTHSDELASRFPEIVHLKEGRITQAAGIA
ncbi:MAG: ABC transporter ATP-binding protein [Planctomycetaceae bacterium]|nr:ABC transporter ATP-binding protein [Planctomycetaceae bacterium]